jgi:acetylornithine aminotransferase
MAAAAIAAVARTILEEDLAGNAARVGDLLRGTLAEVRGVVAVHGRGLMLGVDLDRPARPVVKALLGAGFLVGASGPAHQIRLLPPLTLTEAEAATFPPALAAAL